jgi:hypothetical protein
MLFPRFTLFLRCLPSARLLFFAALQIGQDDLLHVGGALEAQGGCERLRCCKEIWRHPDRDRFVGIIQSVSNGYAKSPHCSF